MKTTENLNELKCFEGMAERLKKRKLLPPEFWKEQNEISKQVHKRIKKEYNRIKMTQEKFKEPFTI